MKKITVTWGYSGLIYASFRHISRPILDRRMGGISFDSPNPSLQNGFLDFGRRRRGGGVTGDRARQELVPRFGAIRETPSKYIEKI